MQAVVGQEAPFDHGRERLQLLAGLEVTAKTVERPAEAIGVDIAQAEQRETQRAMRLDLPIVAGATRGELEKLVDALRSTVSTNPEVVEKIRTEADQP